VQPPGTSSIELAEPGRVSGRRALIQFSPGLVSSERLTAGVVLQLTDGSVHVRSALDAEKAEHAFGGAGIALATLAQAMCRSLAEHWTAMNAKPWVPPFETAELVREDAFTAQSVDAAATFLLQEQSALHQLLAAYALPAQQRSSNIVRRVRQQVKSNPRTEHLVPRFNRPLNVVDNGQPLRVDFLGQNLACYFMQLTESQRGIEGSAERAFGKLYELQALRRFVDQRPKVIGLLPEERPGVFELVLVGNHRHPVRRQVLAQIEALADQKDVRMRPVADVSAAAAHVARAER